MKTRKGTIGDESQFRTFLHEEIVSVRLKGKIKSIKMQINVLHSMPVYHESPAPTLYWNSVRMLNDGSSVV